MPPADASTPSSDAHAAANVDDPAAPIANATTAVDDATTHPVPGAEPGDPAHAHFDDRRTGLLFGFACYGYWAIVFPLHLKWLNASVGADTTADQPWWALEILGHRIVWSLVLCVGLLFWLGRVDDFKAVLRRKRSTALLAGTAALVSANWAVFIYAVASDQLYRAGIGYFVTPFVQIALGMIFFHERLKRLQWAALSLALAGVAWLIAVAGVFPWIELALACSFGFYGLLRKRAHAGPIVGLTIETAAIMPIALGYLVVAAITFERAPAFAAGGPLPTALLIATGVSTALPLLWFAAAAKKLPLSTIGFLQFGAPVGQFLLGVLAFGERPPVAAMWWGYALIWVGVAFLVAQSTARMLSSRRR